MYEDVYALSTAFARPLMSKKIVETARNTVLNMFLMDAQERVMIK